MPTLGPRRRRTTTALSGLLLAGVAGTVLVAGGEDPPDRADGARGGASAESRTSAGDEASEADFAAVSRLLARRADAVLDGDRRAFLATVDRGNRRLRDQQGILFDNLRALPVEELYYGVSAYGLEPGRVRGDDPLLRPSVTEHVGLRGVLDKPVANAVEMTFVERDGRWLVGREDLGAGTEEAQTRPWFGGAVDVHQDGGLLTVTDAGAEVGATVLSDSVADDLAVVSDLLDLPAGERLLVDATSNGRPTELSNASGENAGAVSYTVFAATRDLSSFTAPAGQVIKLNPRRVETLVDDHRIMRHELTHFELRAFGSTAPLWVSEGIAEVVGSYPLLLSQSVADDRVNARIASSPVELVSNGSWGDDPAMDYLVARATAEYLLTAFGPDRYLRMLEAFRTVPDSTLHGEGHAAAVLRRVYGLGEKELARRTFELLAVLDR